MKNWKDFVGFQQTVDWFWYTPTKFNVFYMKVKTDDEVKAITVERKLIALSDFAYGDLCEK